MVDMWWRYEMKVIFVLACLASVVYGRNHRHDKYEGHLLYEIQGPSHKIAKLDGVLDLLSVRPANTEWIGELKALVALSPRERGKWIKAFELTGIDSKLVHDNLAGMFRAEDEALTVAKNRAHRDGRNMSWDTYYRHDEINDYLDDLATGHPDLVTVVNAGLSSHGRQIKYVKVSSSRFEDVRKPIIFLDAAIHAREWVTPPVALYILDQLIQDPEGDLTQEIDWIILPVANPDGYEYTHTEDRMWRKTLSLGHPGADECPGVDGNRNFDFGWGTEPTNANPCSIVYEGPSPFSEPETRVIRDAVLTHVNRIQLYIALHSYGNMFLYAYGTNASLPYNGLNLHLAGMRMASAIDERALAKADKYVVGNAAVVLYYSTGTARDWTRAVGVPLTYTLELPGYEYNFIVPPSYINQIVTETWTGIRAQAESYINPSNPTIARELHPSIVTAPVSTPSVLNSPVSKPSVVTNPVSNPSVPTIPVSTHSVVTAPLSTPSVMSSPLSTPLSSPSVRTIPDTTNIVSAPAIITTLPNPLIPSNKTT